MRVLTSAYGGRAGRHRTAHQGKRALLQGRGDAGGPDGPRLRTSRPWHIEKSNARGAVALSDVAVLSKGGIAHRLKCQGQDRWPPWLYAVPLPLAEKSGADARLAAVAACPVAGLCNRSHEISGGYGSSFVGFGAQNMS